MDNHKNIAVFVSGSGTNCENIIKYFREKEYADVALVVSNRDDAYALVRASNLNVDSVVIKKAQLADPEYVMPILQKYGIDFILLGYNFQNGLFKYSDFNDEFKTKTSFSKYNVRTNVDITPAKWLTISADIAGRIEERRNPYSAQGTIMTALHSPANAYPISFTGKDPNTLMDKFMLGGNSLYTNNPLGLLAFRGLSYSSSKAFRFPTNFRPSFGSKWVPSAVFTGTQ